MRNAIIALILLIPSLCLASNFTLEIQTIDEVSAANPIHYAYPSVQYKVRHAAHGGTYPFTWELTAAPSGMTIGVHTGEITWASPTATGSPHTVTVKVTDKEGNTDTESYSLTVSADNFVIIDDSDGEDLADVYAGNQDKVVYLRAGTYTLAGLTATQIRRTSCYGVAWGGSQPSAIIAYPGESVTIDMQSNRAFSLTRSNTLWQDLTFINSNEYTFSCNGPDYATWYNCTFDGLSSSTDVDIYCDQANLSFPGYDSAESYNNVLSCTFDQGSGVGIQGVGILTYGVDHMIVEDCAFSNYAKTSASTTQLCGLQWKGTSDYNVARHNTFTGNETGIYIAGYVGSESVGAENNEITHNYFHDNDGYSGWKTGFMLNRSGTIGATYIERNTIVQGAGNDAAYFRSMTNSDGPVYFRNNVLISSHATDTGEWGDYERYYSYMHFKNCSPGWYAAQWNSGAYDLYGAPATGIIDSSGNLQGSYATNYLGASGWEIAESEYYTEESPDPPTVTITDSDKSSVTSSTTITYEATEGTTHKWRIGSPPDDSNGTECTSPAEITGLQPGANTVYIGARDAAGNWGSDSITVNYNPVFYRHIGGSPPR